ncbi:DivIVA domain-containing protein [Dactylosporangium sp. NPDC048998]|uniref:DivIVA domain-containing protein n=1 Tax=Dactylosporangium sp. NPDC048998 TaxID=3363976 RepID=UPI003722340B
MSTFDLRRRLEHGAAVVDRADVDLVRPSTMGLMIEFEVVLRGYDRFAVDMLVQAVDAAAGDREQIDAAFKEISPLPVVLRGYDRAQVDAWLAQCRAGGLGAGPAPEAGTPVLELSIVLRGYRATETDALLATVHAALEGGDPVRRAEALRAITEAQLPVGFRGYDRGQVDTYLSRAAGALRAS